MTCTSTYQPQSILPHAVSVGEETHEEEVLDVKCHSVLFAGGQLTVKQARSARAQRNNSENARGKLEGFVPLAQDWHAGLCFLQVRMSQHLNHTVR